MHVLLEPFKHPEPLQTAIAAKIKRLLKELASASVNLALWLESGLLVDDEHGDNRRFEGHYEINERIASKDVKKLEQAMRRLNKVKRRLEWKAKERAIRYRKKNQQGPCRLSVSNKGQSKQ